MARETPGVEEMGTCVLFKLDKQLFRRNTRGVSSVTMTECQFADDVALLATTREAAELAINAYQSVAKSLGLNVSLTKTKFMIAGVDIAQEKKAPIEVEGGVIGYVEIFQYLHC